MVQYLGWDDYAEIYQHGTGGSRTGAPELRHHPAVIPRAGLKLSIGDLKRSSAPRTDLEKIQRIVALALSESSRTRRAPILRQSQVSVQLARTSSRTPATRAEPTERQILSMCRSLNDTTPKTMADSWSAYWYV